MFFKSDNAGPAHPKVIEALVMENAGYESPYGADTSMAKLTQSIRDVFEAPDAAVYLVGTGTAANVLSLATLSQPWQTIFCSPLAHIHEDESTAPEFFTGGARLHTVGEGDKITPEALERAIAATGGSVHNPQRGPLSLTQVTERGQVYSLDEIRALTALARAAGLPVHMDGARFANALVALGCTPAEMTWKAGIDVLSFGGTKNGCLGVEAVILFDPTRAAEFELRRKRGAQLFSKNRYLAAQMNAYLADDLWLQLAGQANANMAHLAEGLRHSNEARFLAEPQANMLFATLPRMRHKMLFDAGAQYYLMEGALEGHDPDAPLTARFVCDWSLPRTEIEKFLTLTA